MPESHILTLRCQDRPGVVAAVATLLFEQGGNITEAQQFNDAETGGFFMRVVFDLEDPAPRGYSLAQAFAQTAERFGMRWQLRLQSARRRVLILVSQYDHCLRDLLYHARTGELPMEVVAIASNHPRREHEELVGTLPYSHLPVTPTTRLQQEQQLRDLIERSGAELIVLARYMQVLSDGLAASLAGRCINIHHSFLPGFKGAKPYHQAHHRGVKIIGATAHYVTSELDEGPIIVQDVESVDHTDTVERMIEKGRDIERRVLTRAVRYHLEDRVLMNGSKTIVFG